MPRNTWQQELAQLQSSDEEKMSNENDEDQDYLPENSKIKPATLKGKNTKTVKNDEVFMGFETQRLQEIKESSKQIKKKVRPPQICVI